jgi:hypothetical protein
LLGLLSHLQRGGELGGVVIRLALNALGELSQGDQLGGLPF